MKPAIVDAAANVTTSHPRALAAAARVSRRCSQPVTAVPCGHTFCRPCFYPGLRATGGATTACPLCRTPIEIADCDPPVDATLWSRIRAEHSTRVERRAKVEAAKDRKAAQEGGSRDGDRGERQLSDAMRPLPNAPPREVTRTRLRDEMRRHQSTLLASVPDYFQRLEAELNRSEGELLRCRCPARYVTLRQVSTGFHHRGNLGREYHICPKATRGARSGCNFFEWLV